MHRRHFLKALAVLGVAGRASAGQGDIIVGPGETLNLGDDLVLTGATNLIIQGNPDQPCAVEGNSFSILSKGWTGSIRARYCTFRNLGTPSTADTSGAPAVAVTAYGAGVIHFKACDFDACNQVLVTTHDGVTADFHGNLFRENGTFWIDKEPYTTQPALVFDGSSAAPKVFQRNTLLRGSPVFRSAPWRIGGHGGKGNLISGFRGGIVSASDQNEAVGNYFHALLHVDPDMYPFWSQVTNVAGAFRKFEGNIVNTGRFLLRQISGEFAYNLLVNVHGANFIQYGQASVHHNIFAHVDAELDRIGDNYRPVAVSFIEQGVPADSFDFYNNTLDARGIGPDWRAAQFGVTLDQGTFMPRIANNIFFGVPGNRVIGPVNDSEFHEPYPERLGFGDYNLFWDSPGVPYAVSVPGKSYGDDGFGANDVFLDPEFQGPLLDEWPFDEDDILAGKVTVSDMLAYYRELYSLSPDSPIYGAGIGAV